MSVRVPAAQFQRERILVPNHLGRPGADRPRRDQRSAGGVQGRVERSHVPATVGQHALTEHPQVQLRIEGRHGGQPATGSTRPPGTAKARICQEEAGQLGTATSGANGVDQPSIEATADKIIIGGNQKFYVYQKSDLLAGATSPRHKVLAETLDIFRAAVPLTNPRRSRQPLPSRPRRHRSPHLRRFLRASTSMGGHATRTTS